MSAWAVGRSCLLGAGIASIWLVGCGVDATSESGGGGGYGYASSSGGSGTTSSSSGGTNRQPMLVDVDPNQTLSASPGDGVGVFTEYKTGGHWHVWWTCDTNMTALSCAFDVKVSVTTGSIASAAAQLGDRGDALTQADAQDIEATANTTTGTDGITFDTVVPTGTTPVITLTATINGTADPEFLFFVQKGEVNGGFPASRLTDPLMLEPSTP